MSSKDNLGDRIKNYEKMETSAKFMKGIPLIIRLDGRSFSKYTKNFKRPFDDAMSDAMFETTKALVKESNALIGHTQSDEITLILHTENPKSELLFAGKKFKIISNLASIASIVFHKNICDLKHSLDQDNDIPKKLPSFDCRAFQVPNKIEAWNALLWRVQDSIRNSVQNLGQANFSHKKLQGKNQNEIISMLEDQKGIIWGDLPSRYKEGRFVRTESEFKRIVDMNRTFNTSEPTKMSELVKRSVLKELKFQNHFNLINNREEFIFNKEDPIYE